MMKKHKPELGWNKAEKIGRNNQLYPCHCDWGLRHAAAEPEHPRCGEISHSDRFDLRGQQFDRFGVSVSCSTSEIQSKERPFKDC